MSGDEWLHNQIDHLEHLAEAGHLADGGRPRDAERVPTISGDLLTQVRAVEVSIDARFSYRPCQIKLQSGEWVDRVYVQEALAYIVQWGVWPWQDQAKRDVALADVVRIESSPSRLPPALANKMYAAGESGMGYCLFTLVLRDGRRTVCVTGNAIDWIDLPDGVYVEDVVDLIPHEGREATETGNFTRGAPYSWCLYRLPLN